MKKLTLLLCTLFLFAGCEKKFDNVVDPQRTEYQFISLTAPETVYFASDPTVIPKIEIRNLPEGSEVWYDVSSLSSNELLSSKVEMKDDGQVQTSGDTDANDNIYSGKFTFGETDFTGRYELTFWVRSPDTGGGESEKKLTLKTITFNGAIANEPPVISNLNMPDSVSSGVDFTITLYVSDVNGLTDIKDVLFLLSAPNGQAVGSFYLRDDGPDGTVDSATNKTSGDLIAGDGIYSIKLSFNATAAKGDWGFEFKAIDKSNITGNIITQKLTLK